MEIKETIVAMVCTQELIFLGSQASSLDLYSCCDGTVAGVVKGVSGRSPSLGNQVLIKRTSDGLYFRYCHMVNGSNDHINIGMQVNTGTKVGIMGNTGKSTGVHLHLECSTSAVWQCGTFLDPRCCFRFWKCKRNLHHL